MVIEFKIQGTIDTTLGALRKNHILKATYEQCRINKKELNEGPS